MTVLNDVCRYIRSKNAGPFWITTDLFFKDREAYDRYVGCAALSCEGVAPRFGVSPDTVRRFEVPELCVLKFSYRRLEPQGGMLERDMHGGQQFVDLLDLPLEPEIPAAA